MVEHNRDIRTARPLQTDMGEKQTETDSVKIEESRLLGKHAKYSIKIYYYLQEQTEREALLFVSCKYSDANMKI